MLGGALVISIAVLFRLWSFGSRDYWGETRLSLGRKFLWVAIVGGLETEKLWFLVLFRLETDGGSGVNFRDKFPRRGLCGQRGGTGG